jgi:molybdenum cofactor cytidylyltransferase
MTSAILLAAGESSRMGQAKALLDWGGVPLIEYQARELAAAGVDDVVVVLGHEAPSIMKVVWDEVRPRVPAELRVVVNEEYRLGRASSLRAGAHALADDADPIVVLSVDQPRPRAVHEKLLASHRAARRAITLPVCDGKRGHPVVLSNALLAELRAASEESQGLRGIIASHEDEVYEVHYLSIPHESQIGNPDLLALVTTLDINTPEEYEMAVARFAGL